MNQSEIRTIVLANLPFKDGGMYTKGTRYSEDAEKFVIIYDGNSVPYIAPQEYGFTHWISKEFITVNQGFIQNNTVNDLNSMMNGVSSGEKTRIMSRHARTNRARDNLISPERNQSISQGNLQSLRGNKLNR
jgi:hypothetical protein